MVLWVLKLAIPVYSNSFFQQGAISKILSNSPCFYEGIAEYF